VRLLAFELELELELEFDIKLEGIIGQAGRAQLAAARATSRPAKEAGHLRPFVFCTGGRRAGTARFQCGQADRRIEFCVTAGVLCRCKGKGCAHENKRPVAHQMSN